MNPILKGAIAFLALGTSGLGYGIYTATQTTSKKEETYADKFAGTLLSTSDSSYEGKWQSRLNSIKQLANGDSLVEELKTIKSKNAEAKWGDLKNWCAKVINNKNQEGKEFDNIQNYCTYSIKEKITNAVEEGGADDGTKWKTAYDKLQALNDGLDTELTNLKSKKDTPQYTAVKEWCTKQYKKPYKGEDDKDFKNASRICLSK